ncbi:MAG TPA: hypothetical protein VGI16_13530 [Candidatus Acidoferrum sp.]|jgi:tetratricopeptide (TPR) repeat protein
MRHAFVSLLVVLTLATSAAPQTQDGPTNDKAKKSYAEALQALKDRRPDFALDDFKKADKQEGGHCIACEKQMIKYGAELEDWKAPELGAEELLAGVKDPKDVAIAHYQLATVLMEEGIRKGDKEGPLRRAHEELGKALELVPKFPLALFLDGRALAHSRQDDAAKAKFDEFLKISLPSDVNRQRAVRYSVRPELARAKMAPAFAITTIDGERITMDDLQGKVVLMDFWAT